VSLPRHPAVAYLFLVRRMDTPAITDAQFRSAYSGIMDRMVSAGWVESYTFTVGKGFYLNWSWVGTQRSIMMKRLIEAYRLQSDDRAAMVFDILCRGESLPSFGRHVEIDDTVKAFWRECVDQLRISRDEDTLLWFTHIITGLAPDGDTPVQLLDG
jgi:hypothetical protein